MRQHLTPNQVKVLRQIYASDEPLVLDNKHRRTLNVLARKNLITFEYLAPTDINSSGRNYYDAIQCKQKASLAKVEKLIEESAGKQ